MNADPNPPRWLLLALVAAVIGSAEASGQEHWVPEDLYGGESYQVVFDPEDNQRAFVTTVGGVYRTVDGAASWQPVQQGFGAGPLTTLVVAPSAPDTLYAVRDLPEIYASTDGGDSWRLRFHCPSCGGGFHHLAVDPVDPQTLYLCDLSRGVQVSRDGGATLAAENGPGCSRQLLATAPGVVFAVSVESGPWRSRDHGKTWVVIGPEAAFDATAIAVDPSDPQRLYLCGRDLAGAASFWVSTDGGDSWAPGGAGLISEGRVVVAPSDPAMVYVWNGLGLQVSTDFGATLAPRESLHTFGNGFRGLAVDPKNASSFLVITPSGELLRAIRPGIFWFLASDGIRSGSVRALRVDGQHPSRLLALQDRALWRRNKDGDFWRRSVQGLPPTPVLAYWLYPPNQVRTFLSTGGRLWHSFLGGGQFDLLAEISLTALAFDPGDADTMISGGTSSQLYRSTDAGLGWAPWSQLPVDTLLLSLAFDPLQPSRLLVGTADGLFRTQDGGTSWEQLDLPGGVLKVEPHPQRPELLFALAGAALYRSEDAGTTWTAVLSDQRLLDFAFAGPESPLLYAVGDHVFRSTHFGESWVQLPDSGLIEAGGQSVAVDPRQPWRPLLGSFRHGLYQLAQSGLFADGFETGDTLGWSKTVL